MSGEWRRDQEQCLRDIEQHQKADQSYLEEGVQLLELTRNAQRRFAKQEAKKTVAAWFPGFELLLEGW